VTPAEHADLDALAKAISVDTAGRFPVATYPLLVPAATELWAQAWQRGVPCNLCPRRGTHHTCGCPHFQARRRLMRYGVWPEGVA
jgi:hypothetical protein